MLSNSKAITVGFAVAMMFYAAGCGLHVRQPQQVTLAPRPSIAPVNIGGGVKVYLTVAVEPGIDFLGHKGSSGGNSIGKITTADDVRAIYQKAVTDGLTNLGFSVLTAPDPAATNLELALLRLRYSSDFPAFAATNVSAAATARVRRKQTVIHEKSYEAYEAYSQGWVFSPAEIEEKINRTFSRLITKLLVDVELLALLRTH